MTNIEICNNALALLGHDRTISSFSDGTTEAVRCNRFYAIARDYILSAFAWEWALKTTTLSASTATNLPTDCVRVVDVRDSSGSPVHATRSANQITADAAATLRYVSNEIAEANWPNHFTDAVINELAYRLYAPMLGNPTTKEGAEALSTFAAIASDKLNSARAIEIQEHAWMGSPADPEAAVKTDIANRALSLVGSSRTIRDFSEDPSDEAISCRQLLPMAVRGILSRHPWEFARTTATTTTATWTIPTDFISLVYVRDSSGAPVNATVSNGSVVTTANSTIGYTTSNVNLSKAPQGFIDSCVLKLAVLLIPSHVTEDQNGTMAQRTKLLMDEAEQTLSTAIAKESESFAWMGEPADPETATKTDIVNRALSLICVADTVKDFDTDPSPIAVRCRQSFRAALVDVLSSHDWDFASETMQVVPASGSSLWSTIRQPDGLVRISSVSDAQGMPYKFKRTGDVISIKNGNRAVSLRYVTDDFSLSDAPHPFIEAVVARLAYLLAGPVSGCDQKRIAFTLDLANRRLSEAVSDESNETAFGGEWQNPFVSARR